MDGTFLLAQISDTHIVEHGRELAPRVDTSAYLMVAVDHLNHLDPRPDLVLVTGDLVNDGRPEQYEHLREILGRLEVPLRLMPGNHDDADQLARSFPEHVIGADRPRRDGVIDGELRIVCLDTSRFPEPGGRLDPEQLEWLEATLDEAPDQDTVVVLHHPPFPTGISHMDGMALDPASAAALAEVVWRHANVERVLCGHLHRMIVRRWAGTIAMTVPSTAHAVALDLIPDNGGGWTLEPPAITLHLWRRGEGIVTHQQPIGSFHGERFGAH